MFEIPKFILYIGAWFSLIGGVWALFERLEIVLREDILDQLSAWLKNDRSCPDGRNWAAIFTSMFDRVFGEKHFSMKCFTRSILASIFAVCVMVLFVTSTIDDIWRNTYFELIGWKAGVPLFVLITIVINPIPDYISILETRILIRYMAIRKRMSFYLIGLIGDFVFTVLIFTVFVTIGFSIYYWIFDDPILTRFHRNIIYMPERIPGIVFPWKGTYHTVSTVWLYSTFFTSIWIWLFLISSFFVKGLYFAGIGLRYLGRFFDTDNKPLRFLGYICMVLITIGFIALPLLRSFL